MGPVNHFGPDESGEGRRLVAVASIQSKPIGGRRSLSGHEDVESQGSERTVIPVAVRCSLHRAGSSPAPANPHNGEIKE